MILKKNYTLLSIIGSVLLGQQTKIETIPTASKYGEKVATLYQIKNALIYLKFIIL